MSAKHTPGPWRVGLTIGSPHVSPEGPWGWYQTDINGPIGEGCFLELRQYHGGEVGQANAHLIAAAPEGLALAEHIAVMATDPYLCGHPEWEHIVAEAQALITKATP